MSSEYNGNILYVKDENGEWIPIPSIVGKDGVDGQPGPQGPQGEPGPEYELTSEDEQEIATIVYNMIGSADTLSY